jgi:RNA polymerase sigma-70 factor (ECF subfamily)
LEQSLFRSNNLVTQWIFAVRMSNASMRSLDDKALIEMTLEGRNECFDALMDRHLWLIRRRVESMISNTAEAEDVLQVAQLKIWTHLSSFRFHSTFQTWITRIAINEVLQSYRRKRMVRESEAIDLNQLAASTGCPERSYARREMAIKITRAIYQLPAQFREIVVLRELRDLSVDETAREIKANRQLVKTRLFRARLMLSKALQSSCKRFIHDRRTGLSNKASGRMAPC